MGVTGRWLRRALLSGLGVLVLTVAAVMVFSELNLRRHGSGHSLEAPVDAVIVLGGGVDPDAILGYSSRRRVQMAVALLQAGRTRSLIFTGASLVPGRIPSAAAMMRDFAVGIGADPARLILEPDAASTFENLRFSFALARDRGFDRLALLTDAFHIARASRLAAYFGHPEVGLVAVDGLGYDSLGNRVWSILREALAWWYNLAKVAGWEALATAGYPPDERGAMIR